jgi:hypothetical protein
MTREDELRNAVKRLSEELYRYDSNPSTWLAWLVELLEQLQQQATEVNPMNSSLFADMITRLADSIRNRLRTGGW